VYIAPVADLFAREAMPHGQKGPERRREQYRSPEDGGTERGVVGLSFTEGVARRKNAGRGAGGRS